MEGIIVGADGYVAEKAWGSDTGLKGEIGVFGLVCEKRVVWHYIAILVAVDHVT